MISMDKNRHSESLGRREAVRLVGLGAALTLAAGCSRADATPVRTASEPLPPAKSPRAKTPAFIAQPNAPGKLSAYTALDWDNTRAGKQDWMSGLPDRVIKMLAMLEGLYYGNAVDQLQHSLQTATRAYRANAEDELVLISLCHDVGKAVSLANHSGIAAELLRPFVSDANYHVVQSHTQFQARFWLEKSDVYLEHKDQPWFDKAVTFSTEWDQESMDPRYPTLPLGHFEPLIRDRLSKPAAKIGTSAAPRG
jgi:predicted HD phosphohydrolase